MSLMAAIALAASTTTLPHCSWDKPGVNPFMGDLVAAVDRYKDIPAATRAKLKARMEQRQYDEIVDIRRDSIKGRYDYGSDIRDMHFGVGQVCGTVSRAKWTEQALERGLVYCEDGQCILVPTVCRNVSRVTRGDVSPASAPTAASAKREEDGPLMFEPPAAGGAPEGGGAGAAGAPGSFAQTAGLPTPSATPGGIFTPGTVTPPSGGGGLIPLPQAEIPPVNPEVPVDPNVPVPGIPEPQTWAMFALGLGAVALMARRRQARAAA